MQLKFFTLATSLLVLLSSTTSGLAQTPPPPKVGYLRFWNMQPAGSGTLQLLDASKPSDAPVASAPPLRYSSYAEMPLGKYRFLVVKAGTSTPLKIFEVEVKAESFFTALASPRSIDLFDDTTDPKAASGSVTVRNFFSATAVDVLNDGHPLISNLPYGQSASASGLSFARLPLTIRTKLPNGTPAEFSVEADFKSFKHATLLLIPDSYGRFAARVVADGKN